MSAAGRPQLLLGKVLERRQVTVDEKGFKVLRQTHFKAGYITETRLMNGEPFGGKDFKMKVALTPEGDYIGEPRFAYRLCKRRGIKPEKADPTDNVCSIGFCEAEQKWYGWSHRALCGFGIGSIVKEGDCTASSGWTEEYLSLHPECDLSLPVGYTATTLAEAKRMAIAFADSVG